MTGELGALTRRVGVSVAGIAATAALIAGCSSGGSHPASTTSSSLGGAPSTAVTPPAGGGGTTTSAAAGGGAGTVGDPFCTGFKNSDLTALASANGANAAIAAWDKYAKDAPSAIESNVQDIDNYLHDLVNKNFSAITAYAQKLAADGQAIGTYYATHCHA